MLYPLGIPRRARMASLAFSLFFLTHQAASAQVEAHALGRLQASTPVSLALSLPLRNAARMDALLHRLYDPASPQYHQFLTPAQFADEFAPTPQEYQAVADAVRAQGLAVTGTHADRLFLDVSGTDAAVESAFGVRLTAYADASGRVFHMPDAVPALPGALAGHISGVIGLDTSVVRQPHLQRLETLPGRPPCPARGRGAG